jgi:hypothetical protein
VLPATTDIAEAVRELRKLPLAGNTTRRTSHILEDLCDQLTDELKISRFGIQVDEKTDVVKNASLITYVRYVLENMFCKPTDGRATSLEVFYIINHCLEENEINWEKYSVLCVDGAHSIPGENAGRRKPPVLSGHIACFIDTHLHL